MRFIHTTKESFAKGSEEPLSTARVLTSALEPIEHDHSGSDYIYAILDNPTPLEGSHLHAGESVFMVPRCVLPCPRGRAACAASFALLFRFEYPKNASDDASQ